MRLVKASAEIIGISSECGQEMLLGIEKAARTCYKSEDNITIGSSEKLVKQLINRKHEAMLEFEDATVRFIVDRGVSHEIVRHRVASFAQESTRYCNYSNDKFNNELTFIYPCFWNSYPENENDEELHAILTKHLLRVEKDYMKLIGLGASPQEARYILPNGIKTEIVMKANLREWRHFFQLRTAKAAHPQMREVAIPLLDKFKALVPIIFDDI